MRYTGPSPVVLQLVHERDRDMCLRCGSPHALQVHHRAPRGRGGTRQAWINGAANCTLLCLACHAEIESRREQALGDGWLISRFSQELPSDIPIRTWRGDYIFLDDEGGMTRVARVDAGRDRGGA